MGSDDEQYQTFSGGNSSQRPNLRLEELKSVEEQQNSINEAEVKRQDVAYKTSAFVISQEEIDAVLTRGSGVQDGKYRIYEQFLKKQTAEENANMLKDEYGWGGAYPALDTEIYGKIDESHDGKGIKISKGSIMEPDAEVLLPWSKVTKRISELISADRYLNDKEKAFFPQYQKNEVERNERYKVSNEFNNIIREYNK
ncbi:MAG: hypothetical protein RR444_11675, partial [Oscillospiraceae bacterium]